MERERLWICRSKRLSGLCGLLHRGRSSCCKSRRSRRLKIAHRFIGGSTNAMNRKSVKRTAGP